MADGREFQDSDLNAGLHEHVRYIIGLEDDLYGGVSSDSLTREMPYESAEINADLRNLDRDGFLEGHYPDKEVGLPHSYSLSKEGQHWVEEEMDLTPEYIESLMNALR
jgi:hypothetical protein